MAELGRRGGDRRGDIGTGEGEGEETRRQTVALKTGHRRIAAQCRVFAPKTPPPRFPYPLPSRSPQCGQPVDGGTTATVVALLQGHLLVVANVGDSDALLGGKLADDSIGFEQLCADHSPTNVDEYIRMAQLASQRPAGWEPAVCAYDADSPSLIEIFRISEQARSSSPHPPTLLQSPT